MVEFFKKHQAVLQAVALHEKLDTEEKLIDSQSFISWQVKESHCTLGVVLERYLEFFLEIGDKSQVLVVAGGQKFVFSCH